MHGIYTNMQKSKSVPAKLDVSPLPTTCAHPNSYHDIGVLLLNSDQMNMAYGEYCISPESCKENKNKIITYFNQKLRSNHK